MTGCLSKLQENTFVLKKRFKIIFSIQLTEAHVVNMVKLCSTTYLSKSPVASKFRQVTTDDLTF